MKRVSALLFTACVAACGPLPSQTQYSYQDVGKASVVEFGTIISERPVNITGQNTGIGATAGALGGGLGGSYIGRGGGSLAGILVGALVGGIIAGTAEQAMANHHGIEYTITEQSGVTITLTQNLANNEKPLQVGQRVMIQTSGNYQRVLAADSMPETVARPKGISVQ